MVTLNLQGGDATRREKRKRNDQNDVDPAERRAREELIKQVALAEMNRKFTELDENKEGPNIAYLQTLKQLSESLSLTQVLLMNQMLKPLVEKVCIDWSSLC